MSKNIKQIYDTNPASSLVSTDLFYLGRSPYDATDDFAAQWSLILSYIPGGVCTVVTGTSANMVENQSFVANNAGEVTLTLPSTCAVGSFVEVIGYGAGGWKIAQGAGQQIQVGSQATTAGAMGSVESQNRYDAIRLICVVANQIFITTSGVSQDFTIS